MDDDRNCDFVYVKMLHSLSLPERGWKGVGLPVLEEFILRYGKYRGAMLRKKAIYPS